MSLPNRLVGHQSSEDSFPREDRLLDQTIHNLLMTKSKSLKSQTADKKNPGRPEKIIPESSSPYKVALKHANTLSLNSFFYFSYNFFCCDLDNVKHNSDKTIKRKTFSQLLVTIKSFYYCILNIHSSKV